MSLFRRLTALWREDPLLRSVVRNTSYLFSGNTVSMGLISLQGLLAASLLGAANYGILGAITAFASNVNRLLSFRMNELVVKFGGAYLAEGQKTRAAALVKAAGLTEMVTSFTAYVLLFLLAEWGATVFIKDPAAAVWIRIYGLALLANLASESSQAVLQLGRHYRTQAALALTQNIITAAWILAAFLLKGDIYDVLMAYLVGKSLYGLGMLTAALYYSNSLLNPGWWKEPLRGMEDWRGMAKFAFSTNLSQTVNLLNRDSEILWISYFLSSVEAGYYKFALAIMNVILMPISPFIHTTFPEITRSVTKKAWKQVRNLLKRTSTIALVWTSAAAAGLLLFGKWGLSIYKGGEFLPSLPIIWILLVGFGFANVFYWNRLLILAFNRPKFPLVVTTIAGLVKIGLMFLLVPIYGVTMQAILMSLYFVSSISVISLEGLKALSKAEKAHPDIGAAA
ncbi:MAG: lipopolysaccharide biosynthesis protein [Bellilinea sp.]